MVPDGLEEALRAARDARGEIGCDRLWREAERFSVPLIVARCRDCGHAYLDPRPVDEDLPALYLIGKDGKVAELEWQRTMKAREIELIDVDLWWQDLYSDRTGKRITPRRSFPRSAISSGSISRTSAFSRTRRKCMTNCGLARKPCTSSNRASRTAAR